VWIEATDVPGAVERAVAAGAELILEPERKPWGQTVAYVRDPNGTLVEIGEPVADG
jgi:lactoylglutathione lyase